MLPPASERNRGSDKKKSGYKNPIEKFKQSESTTKSTVNLSKKSTSVVAIIQLTWNETVTNKSSVITQKNHSRNGSETKEGQKS